MNIEIDSSDTLMTILSFPPDMLGGNCALDSTQNNEEGVVAVVEFLSAFTLFLMILTAFMSLAQLELSLIHI